MKPWRMPGWMQQYADYITNTGSSEPDRVTLVERMYNGQADPRVNLPLSTLQACVKAQVGLLYGLHEKGLLRNGIGK